MSFNDFPSKTSTKLQNNNDLKEIYLYMFN